MKTILVLLTTLALAAPALATETADMVPGGAPASRCAIGTESGTTWTGNDASNPIYCSLTSGGFSSSGLATTARQDTGNTSLSSITTNTGHLTDGTQVVKGIPAPCASAPLTKLYTTLTSRRSPTVSLGATYTWAVVTNNSSTKLVGIRLAAADSDPYVIPPGASMPTIYPAAGVANLYPDTITSPTTGGDTISIYACP